MDLLKVLDAAGSFMRTNGDKAHFDVVNNKLVGKFVHNGVKRSFVKYNNGTIVETVVHKVIGGK